MFQKNLAKYLSLYLSSPAEAAKKKKQLFNSVIFYFQHNKQKNHDQHFTSHHKLKFTVPQMYGISDKSSVVPRIKHFLCGVVINHGVVAKLVCELYVWVPLFSGLREIGRAHV